MTNWRNIDYLTRGNTKQKLCHQIIVKHKILEILKNFDPIIIGTIPIEIDIESSDIDIACQSDNLILFRNFILKKLSHYPSFTDNLLERSYSASFNIENIPIEIYAEPTPVEDQNGYRHMVIEKRLLDIGTDSFRDKIIDLKKQGYKTEPAFGKLLKMENPYLELLYLEELDDTELGKRLNNITE
ncbi:MAG: DUF4269 domain-containing protein [Dysgonomonas sp.]